MSSQSPTPRLALIGCGAIAELFHLPAFARLPRLREKLVLVDANPQRLRAMADRFGTSRTCQTIHELDPRIQGVIIATPPTSHCELALHFLQRGIHVLCEKPLSESVAEAREVVQAAASTGATLAVNQTRRLFPTYEIVREWIAHGEFGRLQRIEYHDGCEFSWPAATAFHFSPNARGALSDTGIHLLDTVCWWLNDTPNLVACYTDADGGPEAMATVDLEWKSCQIEIKVSRLGNLRNGVRITGSKGRLDMGIEDWSEVRLYRSNSGRKQARIARPPRKYSDVAIPLLQNFAEVCAGRAAPLISGESTLPAVTLLAKAYAEAQPYAAPWDEHWESLDVA